MALFGKKKGKTVDFTNRMVRQHERAESIRENISQAGAQKPQQTDSSSFNPEGNGFGFLDNASSYNQTQYPAYGASGTSTSGAEDAEEKKRKLAKRLMDITDKLEEISNQIYHLQQRVEVLEKKSNPGNFGY